MLEKALLSFGIKFYDIMVLKNFFLLQYPRIRSKLCSSRLSFSFMHNNRIASL